MKDRENLVPILLVVLSPVDQVLLNQVVPVFHFVPGLTQGLHS